MTSGIKTIRSERYVRGVFGRVAKWAFICFNGLMIVWLLGYWGDLASLQPTSDAERVGAALGGMMGTSAILFFWIAGAVILGLAAMFTRGRKVIVEEIVE